MIGKRPPLSARWPDPRREASSFGSASELDVRSTGTRLQIERPPGRGTLVAGLYGADSPAVIVLRVVAFSGAGLVLDAAVGPEDVVLPGPASIVVRASPSCAGSSTGRLAQALVRVPGPGAGVLRAGGPVPAAASLGDHGAARLHGHLLGDRAPAAHGGVHHQRLVAAHPRLRPPPDIPRSSSSFIEAGLGLGIVALIISYLPTIYGAFNRRETLVGMLEARAGLAAEPGRAARPLRPHRLAATASTTTVPRRGRRGSPTSRRATPASRRWCSSARRTPTGAGSPPRGACSTPRPSPPLDRQAPRRPRRPHAAHRLPRPAPHRRLLRHRVRPRPPARRPDLASRRREFDLLCVELQAAGVPLKADRDQAWRDFAGWRVNYDRVLIALCELVVAPPAKWSSDRANEHWTRTKVDAGSRCPAGSPPAARTGLDIRCARPTPGGAARGQVISSPGHGWRPKRDDDAGHAEQERTTMSHSGAGRGGAASAPARTGSPRPGR